MTVALSRTLVFPEKTLPDAAGLIAEGRAMAREVTVGRSPFLETYGVGSEIEYKRKAMAQGRIMMHAQIGFRDLAKSRRAYHEIWDRLAGAGCRVDRYGICLDWSMGYPRDNAQRHAARNRSHHARHRRLDIIDERCSRRSSFRRFRHRNACRFREHHCRALLSGSTSIGNLGQYFAFRQPHWDDDIFTTAESLKAIALTAAQPVPVIVHSNLDDGFASIFTDLSCSLGTILLEQYIVDELCGGHAAYSFGNTYAKPFSRLAFQRAAQRISTTPGTMIYGATTMYGPNHAANYAALATYLRVDIYGEKTRPAGHAVNPTPVTEADRIPDIDEIIDVHMFANRLVELDLPLHGLYRDDEVDAVADQIVLGGRQFKSNVLNGFTQVGIDIGNPFEMLLAIRRVGSKRLEELYGPGKPDPGRLRGRMPLVRSHSIEQLEQEGEGLLGRMTVSDRNAIAAAGLRGCIATTDVHEYGKVLIETVLKGLGVEIIDGGISTDPNDLALQAQTSAADFIALSSYNGVALQFVTELRRELGERGTDLPVFIGGKLNRIPDGTNTSLPVDISKEIAAAGAIVCTAVDAMITQLLQVARNRPAAGNRHRAR